MVPESLGAELRIHYGYGCFDTFQESMAFEQALIIFLESYGFKKWASGKDMLTGVRDIAYARRGTSVEGVPVP